MFLSLEKEVYQWITLDTLSNAESGLEDPSKREDNVGQHT